MSETLRWLNSFYDGDSMLLINSTIIFCKKQPSISIYFN